MESTKSGNRFFGSTRGQIVRLMRGSPRTVEDLAASFQAAVVDVLFKKTIQAARDHHAQEILVAGGVSANRALP